MTLTIPVAFQEPTSIPISGLDINATANEENVDFQTTFSKKSKLPFLYLSTRGVTDINIIPNIVFNTDESIKDVQAGVVLDNFGNKSETNKEICTNY